MTLEYHPIANIFPLIEGKEFDTFAADIQRGGPIHEVLLYEGKILDGRNRYRACEAAGIKPTYIEFCGTPEEAIERVWSENIVRRHLNSSQKACADAVRNKLLNSYAAVREAAKARQAATSAAAPRNEKGQVQPVTQLIESPVEALPPDKNTGRNAATTNAVRAKAAHTNREYIDLADKLMEEQPEVFAQVQKGEKKLSDVQVKRLREVRKPKKKTPSPRAQIAVRGGKANQRIRDSVVKCMRKERPLSYPEIASLTGYAISYMDEFVTNAQLLPWVSVKISFPKSSPKERGKYDRIGLYQFFIDEELKAICEGKSPSPTARTSVLAKVKALYQEIVDKREEMQGRHRDSKWNPESISRLELTRVLDHFQDQLALIINPESSA